MVTFNNVASTNVALSGLPFDKFNASLLHVYVAQTNQLTAGALSQPYSMRLFWSSDRLDQNCMFEATNVTSYCVPMTNIALLGTNILWVTDAGGFAVGNYLNVMSPSNADWKVRVNAITGTAIYINQTLVYDHALSNGVSKIDMFSGNWFDSTGNRTLWGKMSWDTGAQSVSNVTFRMVQ